MIKKEEMRESIRRNYFEVATKGSTGCGCCCSGSCYDSADLTALVETKG